MNGTFDPSDGTLFVKVDHGILTGITTSESGVKNSITITMSDSGDSFFGNRQYGEWITGIRVNKESPFTKINVDTSTPLKSFYSFLALAQKFFNIIDECKVEKLDFFKTSALASHSIVLHQLGTDVTVPMEFIQEEGNRIWKIKKPYIHFYYDTASIVISPYSVDGKTIWQFVPQTLSTIDELYNEMENVEEIIVSLMGSILRILIITVALFAVAEIFNIPYKTVMAGLGIGGLAFAIAAKDTIANFFGSAIIIADRPFKTGDKIRIGTDVGFITNVGIRSTKIRTTQDTILTVPNNRITQEMIDNYSEREAMRIDTEFFLSLDTSKELLDKLDNEITSFLSENEGVDSSKVILTGVNDFTKRGINFGVTFFVKAVNETEYSDRRHRLITDIGQIIRDNDIEMVMINREDKM